MKKIFAILAAIAAISILTFALLAHASFSDIQGHKYQAAIDFIQGRNIVSGYPDGTYRPDSQINRAELLTIIVGQKYKNLLSKNCFTDVLSGQWYAKFVCKGKELGIVAGYSDGNFKPAQDVNFVEALIMLQRAHSISVDTSNSPWFRNSVESASDMNIIPLDITSFDQQITRGQMAELMARFLKYEENNLNDYLGEKANYIVTYSTIENGFNVEKTVKKTKSEPPPDIIMYDPFGQDGHSPDVGPALDCANPENGQFCNRYNAAQKFFGFGTYNLKDGDMAVIDRFIFERVFRNIKITWIDPDGNPLPITSFYYNVDVTMLSSVRRFGDTYFIVDIDTLGKSETQFIFTGDPQTALDWCGQRSIPDCGGSSFSVKRPGEVVYQTEHIVGFVPSGYESHNRYLVDSLEVCYSKLKDYIGFEPFSKPLYSHFIPTQDGGGCMAGFDTISCAGTEEFLSALQNDFRINGRSYRDLVSGGNCLSDSAQPHELTHLFFAGTLVSDMYTRGLNEGLADYLKHTVELKNTDLPEPVTCHNGGFSEYGESIEPYVDLNTLTIDANTYHTGECVWKYIEDNYGHDKFIAILQKLDDMRFKPGTYAFFKDVVKPVIGTDIFPDISSKFNLSSDPVVSKQL